MFRPVVVPHGITDIIDAPVQSIVVYGTITPLVYFLPLRVKTGLLVAGSIYHMRHDVPNPTLNVLMHIAWIYQPWIAHTFLTFIHTPRHYLRTLDVHVKQKKTAIGIMTVVTIADMFFHWSSKWTTLWWVGPVVAHIIMTEYLNQ